MASRIINLALVRSDLGDGGWSLHGPDDEFIISGPAKLNKKTGDWSRPSAADYRRAQVIQSRKEASNG